MMSQLQEHHLLTNNLFAQMQLFVFLFLFRPAYCDNTTTPIPQYWKMAPWMPLVRNKMTRRWVPYVDTLTFTKLQGIHSYQHDNVHSIMACFQYLPIHIAHFIRERLKCKKSEPGDKVLISMICLPGKDMISGSYYVSPLSTTQPNKLLYKSVLYQTRVILHMHQYLDMNTSFYKFNLSMAGIVNIKGKCSILASLIRC